MQYLPINRINSFPKHLNQFRFIVTTKELYAMYVFCRYLKIPDIPSDVARNNTIQDLLDLYRNLIDEFKEVHKRTRMLEKENASEIINDIKEMAVERDIGLYL